MNGDNAGEATADTAVGTANAPGVRAAIARAKLEGEGTVDALPDLICLLDASGHLLRGNRVCERWNRGSSAEVPGRDLHRLVHNRCAAEHCQRHESPRSARPGLRE